MNITNYPAIFYKEDSGDYSVIFPDLNGLATYGKDLDDAMSMAIDCLAGYIYSLKLEKNEIHKATDRKNIDISVHLDGEYDNERVFINYIAVNVDEYAKKHFNKSVKKSRYNIKRFKTTKNTVGSYKRKARSA